jgi:polysaccharide biosynthesis/export protein
VIDATARVLSRLTAPVVLLVLGACAQMPASGPSTRTVEQATSGPAASVIQIVDVDDGVARQLASQRRQQLFSETLGLGRAPELLVGRGDSLEVNIWEAPPATLFGGGISGIHIRTFRWSN